MKKELRTNRVVNWSERPPFPHNMLMELTNSCNHKCIFCGYKDMRRKKSQCDKNLMFDVMRQAYENGTREIGFYMIGEPFMCQDLEEYVSHANDLGYEYIYLTTNGALANIDRVKKVIEAGLNSIKYSVNAATRKTYKEVHGNDDFITVKKNIAALKEYVSANNIDLPIFISFIKNEINKSDVEKVQEEFEGLVDKVYIYDCANQGGGMMQLVSSGIVKKEDLHPGAKLPCNMIFNRLHITCEGYLDACCVDVNGNLIVADLHDVPLVDAWYSDIMIGLRRQHLKGDLKPIACYNCVNNADVKIIPLNEELFAKKI